MRSVGAVALVLMVCPFAFSQASNTNRSGVSLSSPQAQPPAPQSQQPPNYANYSIMLVNPAGGSAVVLMYNPKNQLEFIAADKTGEAFAAGYVPVRAAEIAETIGTLREENARLAEENAQLRNIQAKQDSAAVASTSSPAASAQLLVVQPVSPAPSQSDVAAQEAARRQQIIQTWLMLQPRTQNLNINVRDCTRFPALCAGR